MVAHRHGAVAVAARDAETDARVSWSAAGAGLSLALACDLRVSIDTAKFTTAFSKIGLAGDYGGRTSCRTSSAPQKRELYFTADVISAQEALKIGLVNHVFPAASFEADAVAFARKLGNLPTVALGYMKKNLNAAERGSLGRARSQRCT
jgi:2-(1,2-epoxy-1,2-dihydrophenyl)acetyl-CoA isomerase